MTTIILEGKEYQIDIEQEKKLNLLKEKNNRVKSWKEFETKHEISKGYYWSDLRNDLVKIGGPVLTNEQLTPHEAKALAAFSKLLKLRRDWIGEWEPDWTSDKFKYMIVNWRNDLRIEYSQILCKSLSFPTQQMAQEFLETFRELIEEAKILI